MIACYPAALQLTPDLHAAAMHGICRRRLQSDPGAEIGKVPAARLLQRAAGRLSQPQGAFCWPDMTYNCVV